LNCRLTEGGSRVGEEAEPGHHLIAIGLSGLAQQIDVDMAAEADHPASLRP